MVKFIADTLCWVTSDEPIGPEHGIAFPCFNSVKALELLKYIEEELLKTLELLKCIERELAVSSSRQRFRYNSIHF
ncbi:hypothetical protein B8W66_06225 [Mycobacterium decipiens]|uniref:Uncharacterized protein n=1 Tax=Mycobacterium decipiens TaxID=1430326 RepID=A0A1X2LY75_9MYCO|nr:hypothetical protein B8W66_06225 [Mycobacterium decipiens]